MNEAFPKPETEPEKQNIFLPEEVGSGPKEKQPEDLRSLLKRILAEETKSTRSNSTEEKLKLARLKSEASTFNEEYERTLEKTEKAVLYNKWREAVQRYLEQEELMDTMSSKELSTQEQEQILKDLLEKRRAEAKGLKEEYERVIEVTEKAVLYNKWRDALKKCDEVEELLDMLTALNGSTESPIDAADKTENADQSGTSREDTNGETDPTQPTVEIEPAHPTGDNQPDTENKPDAPPNEPLSPHLESIIRGKVAFVDANAQVELMARTRAVELLNEKLKHGNWFKRKWVQSWESGYRMQLIQEQRKKILGQENRPGLIRKMLFGAQTFEATGVKNLFAGTENEGGHEGEMEDIAARFVEDLHRTNEGEVKRQLEDQEFTERINGLIYDYASGSLDDAAFAERRFALTNELSKKYPAMFAEGGLTADNLFEAARNIRKVFEHGCALARTDVRLSIDLGVARQAIKTQANLTWIDKVTAKAQHYFGPGASPEAIGFGAAIGSYFFKKPIFWLGGAAGAGGVLGAMRRNVEQKRDLEMHRRERAMGDVKPEDAPHREAMERFVHEMRPASEIINQVRMLSNNFSVEPTPENAQALTMLLAEAEARMSLSESRQCDLISYPGETRLERNRLELLRSLKEAGATLKKEGYESDITASDVYKQAHDKLTQEINAINRSELAHRWKENGKAAAVGAIGGLLVGGLVQQSAAFVGDRFSSLSWLRPGGKATSFETLYGYIKEHISPNQMPAGTKSIIDLPSVTCMLKTEGTTELILDKSTGLTVLVDKSDHSRILAKFTVTPQGKALPVPGSFDPQKVVFHEKVVQGSARTSLSGWLQSMQGKFGNGVKHETWTTERFLDNNTPLPKAEFNELKLHMRYDTKGDLIIDAGKLQEFQTDALGKQMQGSMHGNRILDAIDSYKKGTIKIGIVPDGSQTKSVLELAYDPQSKAYVAPKGSEIQRLFEADAQGRPVLKGTGFMGIVNELGTAADGSKRVEWINSVRGNGHAIDAMTTSAERNCVVTEISTKDWWGPWIWSFGRKPLEQRERGANNPGGNDFDHIEPITDESEEIEGKEITGVHVDTRGQKIESDRKDWNPEFPKKFPLKNEEEMADVLIAGSLKGLLTPKELEQYLRYDREERRTFLITRLKKDKEIFRLNGQEGFDRDTIARIVNLVLEHVNAYMAEHAGTNRGEVISPNQIHVVGTLEYRAQIESTGNRADTSLGMCFTTSGEIFVNFDEVRNILERAGRLTVDNLFVELKRIIAHEAAHGSVANNYWVFETGDMSGTDEVVAPRRAGITTLRREDRDRHSIINSTNQTLIERGRALNEAVTEEMAQQIIDALYTKEVGRPAPQEYMGSYAAERHVLALLQKKFDIPFNVFAQAAINRKSLRTLVRRLDGQKVTKNEESGRSSKRERPHFTSLLFSIMDSELHSNQYSYTATKKLIKGERGILITSKMKERFPSNLLDSEGNIKEAITTQYGIIDEDVALRIPKVA